MAQELGLELVAEGVETEEQMNHLVGRCCTTIQGFLFSKPLPSKELEQFVREWKLPG
jgi:EAL domain-containing protein (putative c-di-GMP-specific phosphodiesterase class I)